MKDQICECPCGCGDNILKCVYTPTYAPEKKAWLEKVQDIIWDSIDGCYLDFEEQSGWFIQKILRLFSKYQPEKAAKVVIRYVSFTNWLYESGKVA